MGDMVTGLLGFGTMPSYFGPIEYNVCFPVVEILEIWSSSDAFIPLENQIQVVESVKRIDLEGKRWDHVEHYARLYIRIFDIFPNAKESVRKILDDLLQHNIKFGRCGKTIHFFEKTFPHFGNIFHPHVLVGGKGTAGLEISHISEIDKL
ncbi:hypothetical protein Fcan01_26573 [Folsomia candida]|uniref:Uncharacterized protein n=1 Tax=Folsomia candida TaxID=158441 RepID=A0A226D035_FOLCA|nr:hypothetical protein Fcan01_26573 [Folsomia candida]